MRALNTTVELLRDVHVAVLGGDGDTWRLRLPVGIDVTRKILPQFERAGLADIPASLDGSGAARPLVVARTATRSLLQRARAGDVDILLASPSLAIIDGAMFEAAQEPQVKDRDMRHSRRPSWNRWAVMRVLAASDQGITQAEFVAILHTSQQNISKILRGLEGVERDASGRYRAVDREQILEKFTDESFSSDDMAFGWYALDDVVKQAVRAFDIAEVSAMSPLLSGDIAADEIAPWHLPTRALLYVNAPIDLEGDGFVSAPLDEATLVTVVPRDRTLWQVADWQHGSNPRYADLATVYRDLLRDEGPDTRDAARVLAEKILESRVPEAP